LCQSGWRENSGKWWALGIWWHEVYEDLGYYLVRYRQDRVFVWIEPSLHKHSLSPQCSEWTLKIQDFSLNVHEADTVHFKSSEHRWVCSWGIREKMQAGRTEIGCFYRYCEPSELLQQDPRIQSFDTYIPPYVNAFGLQVVKKIEDRLTKARGGTVCTATDLTRLTFLVGRLCKSKIFKAV
jgi:hypothetical protein